MTWKDYGMSKQDRKRVERFCQNPSNDELVIINAAIESTNPHFSNELYNAIVGKQSYVKQSMKQYIPISEKDFYGYRRKAIYKIYSMIMLLGLDKPK